LQYKYQQENIPISIAKVTLESEKQSKDKVHYMQIHRGVEDLLGHPISDRQVLKHLSKMIDEKLLNRKDPTGKRGSKVFFWSTEKLRRKYHLKIIGIDEEVKKRKKLYLLLILFEIYKRGPLLTEKELSKFLSQIGSSIRFLAKDEETKGNISGIVFKPINGVEIAGFSERDPTTKTNKTWYYIVLPGISIEEFMAYLKLVSKGIEPHPFSSLRIIIPFTLYISYTKKEVEEGLDLLSSNGIMKRTAPIIPDEARYNLVDQGLRSLIIAFWQICMFDFELLMHRLASRKPTDEDKRYLELYLGEQLKNQLLSSTFEGRRSYKKEVQNRKIEKEAIRNLEHNKQLLVQQITGEYQNIIHKNGVICELLEEICHFPSISQIFNLD
jgi:hypothetical protein